MKNLHNEDDHLFLNLLRERSRKLEVEPDELVWANIQDGMKKKRRRIILIGVAATILFTLFVLNSFFPTSVPTADRPSRPGLANSNSNDAGRLEKLKPALENSLTTPFKKAFINQNLIADASNKNFIVAIESDDQESKVNESPAQIADGRLQNSDKINGDSVLEKPWKELITHDTVVEMPIEKKKKRRLNIYGSVNPSLNYQIVSPLTTDGVLISGLKSPGVISTNRMGLGIEAGLMIPISKRWEGFAGVNYFQQHNVITYYYKSSGAMELGQSSGNSLTFNPRIRTQDVAYDMENIGVQSGVFFKFKQGILTQKAGLSFSYQHGMRKTSGEMIYDNSQSNYLFVQLHYRFEFALTKRMNMFIQPTQAYSIWSSEKLTAPFKLTPYRASINFGLVFNFQ
jgi:hypothetical protein